MATTRFAENQIDPTMATEAEVAAAIAAAIVANTQQFAGNNTAGPYALSAVPKPNSLQVSINGLEQNSTHFSVSGNAIYFGDVVETTDSITIHYLS